MMYNCAWQAAELPPEWLTSSRMIDASAIPSPDPPMLLGNQRRQIPGLGQRA